ncbi:MAG: rhomboid family intramembrane serine protease [Dehalococcoidales bacterium]
MDSILILILINALVFVGISTRTPEIQQQIIQTLGLTPTLVWSHPWQIITSMFTHQEFLHILFNMWTLYFFGSAILQILGTRKFWIIYMVGGIMGSIFYILLAYTGTAISFGWFGDINTTAIGASGAIFALGGALAVLRPSMRVIFFPIPVPMPLWIAIVGSFVVLTLIPGVAWTAHLGGLAFGAAAGWYYKRNSFNEYRWN